ncbi:MAG: glycosyltransferase [Selenomonas ruminantium]|nr:glycosyltransferase [Selenomonas ruminantium]
MRISACYIVKDEAEELRRSLEGVKGQADEIIVVQTVESQAVHQAAEQAGARLFYFAWQDDFAAARNFALAQATGDWLLLLDADEYFTKETAGNLRRVAEAHGDVEGLLVPLTNLGQQGEDLLTAPVLRLARRQPGLAYVGRIHEELLVRGKTLDDVRLLKEEELHILHTGYRPEVNKSKAERNLRLLRQELRERQARGEMAGSLYMYLAEACYGLGQAREAEHWARQDIAQGRRQVLYASRSHHILLALLARQARPEDRLQAAERAVQDFPELAEFRAELAAARAAWGDFAGAVADLVQAMELAGRPAGFEPQQFGPADAEQAKGQLQAWRDMAAEAEKLKLSVCMIMKDEAQELPVWLANAQAYAQNKEIIVVDTGSRDNSREMAARAGVRLYDFPWQDDFAAAKNFALEQAVSATDVVISQNPSPPPRGAGDRVSGGGGTSAVPHGQRWLIFLDADETFYHPEGVRGLLLQAIRRHPEAEGFQVLMCHVDTDAADLPIGSESVIRILRQQQGLRYRGRVHEVPTAAGRTLAELPLAEGMLLRHTGYASAKMRAKAERNLRLLQQAIEAEGEQPQQYRYLADCCYALEEYELALHYARLGLGCGWVGLDGNRSLYGLRLHCLEKLQRPLQEQLQAAVAGMDAFPQAAEFRVARGWLLLRLGRMAEARETFSHCESIGRDMGQADTFQGSDACHLQAGLGLIALRQGRLEEAAFRLQEALALDPYDTLVLELSSEVWQDPKQWTDGLRPYYAGRAAELFLPHLYRWSASQGRLGMVLHLQEMMLAEGKSVPEAGLCHDFAQQKPGAGEGLFWQAARDMQDLFVACLHLALPDARDFLPREALELLPASLQQIADCWQAGKAAPAEAETGYETGAGILLAREAKDLYERYALLGQAQSPACQRRLADAFFTREAWAAALALYQCLPEQEVGDGASFWHHLGIVFYRLGDYAVAGECLQRAIESGCRERDTEAFIEWSRSRLQQTAGKEDKP